MPDWLDGFLEGHESPALRILYRLAMVSFILFSVFAGVCNFATKNPAGIMVSFCVLALMVYSLAMVQLYRRDQMDPKFKRLTIAVMIITLVLGAASAMEFDRLMHPPAPCAAPAPETTTTTTTMAPEPTGSTPGPGTTSAAPATTTSVPRTARGGALSFRMPPQFRRNPQK